MEFNYTDEINEIYESYISLNQKILNMNNDLYRKEYMSLTEQIIEVFIDIYNKNMEYLSEGLIGKISEFLGKIKNGFGNKHQKILERDKKWLSSNKKNLLNIYIIVILKKESLFFKLIFIFHNIHYYCSASVTKFICDFS